MKERPILFSAPMVRAILEGRKTQTRRVIKDQSIGERYCGPCEDGSVLLEWLGTPCCGSGAWDEHEYSAKVTSPYGKIGDRLWVREMFRFLDAFDQYSPESVGRLCLDAGYKKAWAQTQYEADGARLNWQNVGCTPGSITVGKKRSSLHMPRWASRILLEVVSVRVERLQDISDDDARAEGCCYGNGGGEPDPAVTPENHFPTLWVHINGRESWDANPWVWVIEFRRVQA